MMIITYFLHVLSVFLFLTVWSASAESDLTGALTLFQAGQYEEAKEKFLAYPDDPTAIYYTGLCETDPVKAENLFNRLLKQYPAHDLADDALYEIGELRYGRGAYEAARTTFEQIVQTFPEGNLVDQCYYRTGLTWMAEGEPQKARIAFEKVREGSEVTAEARLAVCESYVAEGDTGQAITYGEAILERPDIDEVKGQVLLLLSHCYRATGRERGAITMEKRLLAEAAESDMGAAYAETTTASRTIPQQLQSSVSERFYAIQVGAFKDPANVEKLVVQYKVSGFEVTVIDKVVKGTTLKVILVGRYKTEREAAVAVPMIYQQLKVHGHVVSLPGE